MQERSILEGKDIRSIQYKDQIHFRRPGPDALVSAQTCQTLPVVQGGEIIKDLWILDDLLSQGKDGLGLSSRYSQTAQ